MRSTNRKVTVNEPSLDDDYQVDPIWRGQIQLAIDHLERCINTAKDEAQELGDHRILFEIGSIAGATSLIQELVDRV